MNSSSSRSFATGLWGCAILGISLWPGHAGTAMPAAELGARAASQYQGDGSRSVFQKLAAKSLDVTPPTLKLRVPTAGQRWSNAVFTVSGKASDNVAVSAVWCLLGNQDPILATGTTNWSVDVSLTPGTNYIRAYAMDTSGNQSQAATGTVIYLVPNPLGLRTNPTAGGRVSGVTNLQLLNLNIAYKATAAANKGFAFLNWAWPINFSGWGTSTAPVLTFTMQPDLLLVACFSDIERPTLSIKSPTPNQHVSNAVFTVAGTAKDNLGVSKVWCLTNGVWGLASIGAGGTNWTMDISLVPKTNSVLAYAEDAAGNRSPTNTVKFIYVVSDRLTLSTTGLGTVSPNYSNAVLELGKTNTLTAKPAAGCILSNWVGGAFTNLAVLSANPTLKFVMVSNLVLQANFIPNPFIPAKGNYAGLFCDTNRVTPRSAGYFTAAVVDSGAFTAKLSLPGQTYSFAGKFAADGSWQTNLITRAAGPAVRLNLDLNGGDAMTGEITGTNWVAELAANRAVYSKTNPAPQGGQKYTLAISGAPEGTNQPGGCGFGTLSIDTGGNISFTGTLGDGTNVTQSAFVSKDGQWPLYVAPYGSNGVMLGWVAFADEPQTDFRGMVSWIKAAKPSARYYPAGFVFTNGTEVFGSVYTNQPGMPLFTRTNVVLTLQNALLQHFSGTNGPVTATTNLTLTLTPSTGAFQGSATGLQTNPPLAFKGVVLQKLNAGYGAYFVTNGTGSVQIEMASNGGPFGGLWQQIPGTIHAERFDMGGEGIAYHYPRGTNDWSNFRNENLDLSYDPATGDAFTGWWMPGEWISYSVNVLAPGNYSFIVPAAISSGSSNIHFDLDGAPVVVLLMLQATGSNTVYQPFSVNGVYLPSGHHILSLVMDDTFGANANIGSVQVLGPE